MISMADIPRVAGAFAVGVVAMSLGFVGAVVGAVWVVELGTPPGLAPNYVVAIGTLLGLTVSVLPAARIGDEVRGSLEASLRRSMGVRAETSAKATAAAASGIVGTYGLVGLVERYGIGGVLYAFFLEVIAFIQGIGNTWAKPLFAFANGLANVVSAVFPARIINAAADFTAFSITQGDWAIFGPFTFAVGVVATMMGLGVFMLALRRIDFSATRALFTRR